MNLLAIKSFRKFINQVLPQFFLVYRFYFKVDKDFADSCNNLFASIIFGTFVQPHCFCFAVSSKLTIHRLTFLPLTAEDFKSILNVFKRKHRLSIISGYHLRRIRYSAPTHGFLWALRALRGSVDISVFVFFRTIVITFLLHFTVAFLHRFEPS